MTKKKTIVVKTPEPVIQEQPASPTTETDSSIGEEITPPVAAETYVNIDAQTRLLRLSELIEDAPALFSNNWTAQEVEAFREKESAWRVKLQNL